MCWCCWPFADAWLDDPVEEAENHSKHTSDWMYVPPRAVKSAGKASPKKESTSVPRKLSPSTKSSKSASGNYWVYKPAKASRPVEEISCESKMAGSDYEHWASESASPAPSKSSIAASVAGTAVTGYDIQNGLRKFKYNPANQEKKEETKDEPAPEAAVTHICAPPQAAQPIAQQQVYYMMAGQPPMQYPQYPQHMQMAYPAPAYYGYNPAYGIPYTPMPVQYYPPAVVEEKAEVREEEPGKKKKKSKPEVKKWQGRTKAEVEEDNMRIAAREGVCGPRKVTPKDLDEDQMVWCVEIDGSHTLRSFAAVKEFGGEWKADPRFKDSWYFVREEEKAN